MELKEVLHMNGGRGETSYANNSLIQKEAMLKAKPILQESLEELYLSSFPECLNIADCGCSSGPNSILLVREIIDIIHGSICQPVNCKAPTFNVFLNDLPGNDFNTLFSSLPSFYEKLKNEKGSDSSHCFIAGVPGTFYGRLFPNNFLHFVHSSYSLQWRSQVPDGLVSESGVPLNKGNIYIAQTSPDSVYKAYFDLFEKDFTLFLKSRSEEIIPGGHMVLIMICSDMKTSNSSHKYRWFILELLGITLNDMVLKGLIEEDKLDRFNFPCYAPTVEEVKQLIRTEGSFSIRKFEIFTVDWAPNANIGDGKKVRFDKETRGKCVAMSIRVVTESILANHFGKEVMDDLFERFAEKIVEYLDVGKGEYTNMVLSLAKK